ncbi:hypothetical protein MTJW_14170 [Moorella thermoacetica]|nr:hypothetical protein MTJW_14170 [Moorella thermoacetica]
MAFTRALYYPWIDISNEAWLKNAIFYWEQIYILLFQLQFCFRII